MLELHFQLILGLLGHRACQICVRQLRLHRAQLRAGARRLERLEINAPLLQCELRGATVLQLGLTRAGGPMADELAIKREKSDKNSIF